jgi:exodeoxyribonuclease-3
MRIATWNVNGLRARKDFVLHWLRARQPDLVGIQELKLTDEQFPTAELEQLGYQSASYGQKAWNGVAILSRKPLEVVQRGLPGQEEYGARLLTVRVEDLSFTTVYVPNGKEISNEEFPRKLEWLEALVSHLEAERRAEEPAIVCGDLNLCPEALDSWNEPALVGRIFHTVEERALFGRLLALGFADTFRTLYPEQQTFSWWDYRGGAFHKGQGLRIDFLLASPPVMARVRSVEADRDYRKKKDGLIASDHAPVFADLV